MRRALGFVVALLVAAPGTVPAQQSSPSLRFRVRAWPDGAVVGSSVAAALVPLVWPNSFAHATCAPCEPSHLWGIDRGTVGPVRAAADAFSSGTLGAEAVLGAVFLAASRRGESTAALAEDVAVIAQAVSVTAAATEWAKVLFHRPRPFLYASGATALPSADDGRSLPSSHTSVAFAAAAAYASILHRRGLAGRHRVDIGALFGTAVATGVLRVVAHKHFPTDVVAGAALGFAIGWTLPALHATQP